MVMDRRGFEAVLHSLGARGLQMNMIIGQWFTILDVDSALQKAGLHACLNDAALFRIDGRIAEVFDLEHGRSPTPGAGGGASSPLPSTPSASAASSSPSLWAASAC